MKDNAILFGIIVDTKNIEDASYKTVYKIIGFKALDINSLGIIDIPMSEFKGYDCNHNFDNSSRLIVYDGYTDFIDGFELKVGDISKKLDVDYETLPVYSDSGNTLYRIGSNNIYYWISMSIVLRINACTLAVDILFGMDGKRVVWDANKLKGIKFGTVFYNPSKIPDELKYKLLNKVGDGVYSISDALVVEGTVDRLVLSANTKSLDIRMAKVKELVCNEKLESIGVFETMPDRLYLSKNSRKELICSIIYEVLDCNVISTAGFKLKDLVCSQIKSYDYDKVLAICRQKKNKEILDLAFKGVEVVVY